MLCSINDYCLQEICNNLNLQDHLMLAESCEYLQAFVYNRFQRAQKLSLKQNGNRPFRKPIPKLLWNLKYESYGEIRCDAAKLLAMEGSFSSLQFEGIDNLKIYGSEFNTSEERDELEQLIVNLFPRLRTLESSISFSGKCIAKLKKLSEINVNIPNIHKDFLENLKVSKLTRLNFGKQMKEWQNIAKLESLDELEHLKIDESDYAKLSELPDFKLPQSLSKLTVTAAADGSVLNFDKTLACYAHIESVELSISITMKEFTYRSVKDIIAALPCLVFANDDIKTLNQLYKTYPKCWKKLERVFYFSDSRDTLHDQSLQEKMFETARPIFNEHSDYCFNKDNRVVMVLLSQKRPNRFVVRCSNILSGSIELPYIPKNLEIRMIFKI